MHVHIGLKKTCLESRSVMHDVGWIHFSQTVGLPRIPCVIARELRNSSTSGIESAKYKWSRECYG